jgi:hypothetical protein
MTTNADVEAGVKEMVLLMVFLAPSAARDKRTENVGVQTKAI